MKEAVAMLQRRSLGATGLDVTLVGLGALEIGRDWGIGEGAARQRPDEAGAAAVLSTALDLGINLIDTASAYHRSEERIGKFASARRSEYVLASKCGEHSAEPNTYYDYSYDAIRASIRRSRELLHSDVIDVMQIHFGPEPAKVLGDGECVRAMKDACEAGEIRFLGASINGDMLDRCIGSGDFQVVQVGYSLLHPEDGPLISKARDRGIGVLIRSGIAGGWLTPRILSVPPEKRPPKAQALLDLCDGDATKLYALTLQFLARNDGVSSILVGTKSPQNLATAVRLIEPPPDDELLDRAIAVVANR
jgi:aryl-alcohol dehydrogenase-like predicted oxidoreductase